MYCIIKNFLFLVPIWLKYDRKEVNWSSTKDGLADIPLIAAQWLKHFKHQNGVLLDELNVNISFYLQINIFLFFLYNYTFLYSSLTFKLKINL